MDPTIRLSGGRCHHYHPMMMLPKEAILDSLPEVSLPDLLQQETNGNDKLLQKALPYSVQSKHFKLGGQGYGRHTRSFDQTSTHDLDWWTMKQKMGGWAMVID
jgi:hypothetical protein